SGRRRLTLLLPVLFAVWINTHGGALAGILVLGIAAVASTAEGLFRKDGPLLRNAGALGLSLPVCVAALLLNPWGWRLPAWLVESVLYVRPEIDEWNAAALGFDHGPALLLAL